MILRRPFLEADDGAAGGAGAPEGSKGNESKDSEKPKTFEEILGTNKEFQAELDRRINQAVKTATANERDRQKTIRDNLQDEVLRVSKMTEDEKDAYFKEKAEKKAAEKEANLTKRELTLDARVALADKKLPDEFVDLLDYTDKDACMKSIDVLDVAFQKAVQEAVNEKLKGSAPPKDAKTEGTPDPQSDKDKVLAEMRKIARVKK